MRLATLTVALLLLCGVKAKAETVPERGLWVFEQIGSSFYPSAAGVRRHQLSLNGANFSDSFSFQASGLIDLGAIEIGLEGSQRSFLANSGRGAIVRDQLYGSRQNFGADLGRHFVTEEGRYGGIAVGYLQFMPSLERWIKFQLETGILSTESAPWSLSLHASFFVRTNGSDKVMLVSTDTVRDFNWGKAKLSVGGFFSWGYRMRDLLLPGSFEQMLFSFGPLVRLSTNVGIFRLSIPLRLWIDKQIVNSGTTQVTANPSQFTGIPDAMLSWTLTL